MALPHRTSSKMRFGICFVRTRSGAPAQDFLQNRVRNLRVRFRNGAPAQDFLNQDHDQNHDHDHDHYDDDDGGYDVYMRSRPNAGHSLILASARMCSAARISWPFETM